MGRSINFSGKKRQCRTHKNIAGFVIGMAAGFRFNNCPVIPAFDPAGALDPCPASAIAGVSA